MIKFKHKGNQKSLGRYRANDLLIAFDSLHLGSDGGGGGFPYVFLIQHLRGERKEPEKATVRKQLSRHVSFSLDLVSQVFLKRVLGIVLVEK